MIKKFGLLIVALSLCGCSLGPPNPQQIGRYPSNYRALIKAQMKETFYDPYSLRDVSISTPVQAHDLFSQGWLVCVQANAKNRMGGYVGLTTTGYWISRGVITDSFENEELCDRASLVPWPEMEGGGGSGGGGPDRELKPTEGK